MSWPTTCRRPDRGRSLPVRRWGACSLPASWLCAGSLWEGGSGSEPEIGDNGPVVRRLHPSWSSRDLGVEHLEVVADQDVVDVRAVARPPKAMGGRAGSGWKRKSKPHLGQRREDSIVGAGV